MASMRLDLPLPATSNQHPCECLNTAPATTRSAVTPSQAGTTQGRAQIMQMARNQHTYTSEILDFVKEALG